MSDIKMEELHPTYQQIARFIGIENALTLGREFGGIQLYLPRQAVLTSLERRDQLVYEDYGKLSVNEIARKYGVSVVHVYNIMKAVRKSRTSKNG